MTVLDGGPSPLRAWLVTARLLWIGLFLVVIVLVAAGVPGLLDQFLASADPRALEDLELSPQSYAGYLTALNLVSVLAHLVIGSVVFWRRKSDWLALLLAFALVANGALIPLSLAYAQRGVTPLQAALADVTTATGLISAVLLLYAFPDGRFVPRWTRFLSVAWAALILISIFVDNSPLSLKSWPVGVQLLVLMFWSGSGVLAQIFRYSNVSTLVQRQQTKWAILGLSLAAMGPFGYFLPSLVLPFIRLPDVPNILYQRVGPGFFTSALVFQIGAWTGFTVVLMIFPLSFVVAILRYRLWDIDLLINRTLVYTALTGSLLAFYFTSVVVLQRLFPVQSQVAVVASTLAIAALFNPLRERIQRTIDRRFYRRKYDTEKILAAFSASLRDQVDLADLSQTLLTVVGETMQPQTLSLWLKEREEASPKLAHVRREPPDRPEEGRNLGAIQRQ